MTPPSEHSPLERKLLFPFIAPPNGGKGTQTRRLSAHFGIPKVDTGALLREKAKEDTPLGLHIRERQHAGQLVDTPVVLEVLKTELLSLLAITPDVPGFILDGFPRNREQADGLFEMCHDLGARVARAIYIKVPEEEILRRAVNRRICPVDGAIYNLLTNPPKREGLCDIDGTPLIQRVDDQPEKVRTRLHSFEEETRPMIARFRQAHILAKIDGNRTVEAISEDIIQEMAPFLVEPAIN
jgi:adenylate kinase